MVPDTPSLHRLYLSHISNKLETNWSNIYGATQLTCQKLWTIGVTSTLIFWPGNGAWYSVNSPVISVAPYKANWETRFQAMRRKRQKFRTTHVTLTCDLLPWKWCAAHRPFMGLFEPDLKRIHQISREPGNGHNKNFERPVWPGPLTFWH